MAAGVGQICDCSQHPWKLGVRHAEESSPRTRASRLTLGLWRGLGRAACAISSALLLLSSASGRAGAGPRPVLRVESNDRGAIAVEAHDATLAETLQAIASNGGFEVLIDDRIDRPLVNLTLPPTPVEEVLRQILHGRNYAVLYEAGDSLPIRVIVLPPSTPSARAATSLQAGRSAPSTTRRR
jgi:hypothetical protein